MPITANLFPTRRTNGSKLRFNAHVVIDAIIHLSMRFADLAIIAAYLVFITWFGAQFKEKQATLKDYFLGGRGAPWWAIALSIVSAETSTLTVIGTPALSFAGNFAFLQLVLGYL